MKRNTKCVAPLFVKIIVIFPVTRPLVHNGKVSGALVVHIKCVASLFVKIIVIFPVIQPLVHKEKGKWNTSKPKQ